MSKLIVTRAPLAVRAASLARRALLVLMVALVSAVTFGGQAARALQAIDVSSDADRVEITRAGEGYAGRGDQLQIETATAVDGTTGRMAVRAQTPGTQPNWFVFALHNTSDRPIERWLVADRYTVIGSRAFWPDLDARRLVSVTPSVGLVPEQIRSDRSDIFRLTLDPGQTITFVAELSTNNVPRLNLWKPIEFEQKARDRQLFNGIMLGIVGLLAIFLTAVFAANHKAIFPSAALFTWCVLAYLCVDFGFWHKLFNVRPEENAQYRAAGEAAIAATLLVFSFTFLRLGQWHAFVRSLLGFWILGQILLIAVAFLDPRLASMFARLSLAGIVGVIGMLMTFLALRGQDRALSLVPTWILLAVWLLGTALAIHGRLSGDPVIYALVAGIVMIVVLVGFTVTQYAFRAAEPVYGSQPDELQVRALAVDGSGAALFDWNSKRDEIRVGPAIDAALGLPAGALSAKFADFASRMHPADKERLRLQLGGLQERGGGDLRAEFRMRHVDNTPRWFELEAASAPTGDRRTVRCVGLIREVTDARLARERLMHDAVHDNLTRLPNRALFLDRLEMAARRSQAEPLVRPTVLFIDLDKFKSVNSALGIVTGDTLLLTVARRLARHLGPQDTLARIGGDQFALLYLLQHDARELEMLAENVRRSLRAPMNILGQDIVLTASIGVATADQPIQHSLDLLRDAEIAMYTAKRGGPDQIAQFRAAMRDVRDDRITIESDLRTALDKGQLRVLYQPIIYLPTEQLAGFEALVRWQHPKLGLLNPAEFIPVAEESDLIVRLGSFVLQQAVRDAQRWQKEVVRPASPLFVSVNVSSRQLIRQDLVTEIRHILDRSMLAKGSLRLEITESLVMENPEQAGFVLEELAAAGAGLALDDFGTGYSSLSYLNRFPFDTIKVDRALVHASSQDGSGSVIMRSIVALAQEIGRSVVAEGVENEDDVGFLRSLGCDFAQGFYYGEPMGDREVWAMLRQIRKSERRRERGNLLRLRSRKRTAAPVEAEGDITDTDSEAVPSKAQPPVPLDAPPAAASNGGAAPRPVSTPPRRIPSPPNPSPALAQARVRAPQWPADRAANGQPPSRTAAAAPLPPAVAQGRIVLTDRQPPRPAFVPQPAMPAPVRAQAPVAQSPIQAERIASEPRQRPPRPLIPVDRSALESARMAIAALTGSATDTSDTRTTAPARPSPAMPASSTTAARAIDLSALPPAIADSLARLAGSSAPGQAPPAKKPATGG